MAPLLSTVGFFLQFHVFIRPDLPPMLLPYLVQSLFHIISLCVSFQKRYIDFALDICSLLRSLERIPCYQMAYLIPTALRFVLLGGVAMVTLAAPDQKLIETRKQITFPVAGKGLGYFMAHFHFNRWHGGTNECRSECEHSLIAEPCDCPPGLNMLRRLWSALNQFG